MKILHVLQGTVGGSIEFLNLLLPQLKAKGYVNVVACPQYSALREKCIAQGVEYIELDMCREVSFIKDISSLLHLLKIIKEQNYDILHAHSSKAGVVGRLAAWLKGIPSVYTAHGWSFNMRVSNRKKIFYSTIERALYHITETITCVSQYEVDSAMGVGIASNKLIKIDNAIDLTKYHFQEDVGQLKERLGIPKDKIIIGMVARITEQKNPFLFLDVACALKERLENIYFLYVGDGELRKPLEERMASLGLTDRVLITGWVDQPELYIKCFDIGILTSKWEGFGLVLVEYMACRVPVVASNVDGIPYVVTDGYSGLLCESGNVNQFVNKICSLLQDRTLVDRLTSNAYREAHEKFSIARTAASYDLVYKKIKKSVTAQAQGEESPFAPGAHWPP
ncbi:MAG: glycosyltransferase family 4 protein [Holosporales bacterium]|nr:glycosyltransferase family 4 protein [Holosporales bacterium]